jgi:hypothetical protein
METKTIVERLEERQINVLMHEIQDTTGTIYVIDYNPGRNLMIVDRDSSVKVRENLRSQRDVIEALRSLLPA